MRRRRGRRRHRLPSARRARRLRTRSALHRFFRRPGRAGRAHAVSLALVAVFLHVLGVVVWIGGLIYQAHVLLPAARRGAAAPFAEAAVRARPATWTAIALIVLTGFYNVTQLGSLERVMHTGAGLALAAKVALVILGVALAAQPDFA